MKKILLFAAMFISSAVYADVLIFNMSKKNIAEIEYRVCDSDEKYSRDCQQKILIRNIGHGSGKNYIRIKPSLPLLNGHAEYIQVMSAITKDESGKIVSRSHDGIIGDAMVSSNRTNDQYIGTIILIEDLMQSPYIITTSHSFREIIK